jgi:hypothetical protein
MSLYNSVPYNVEELQTIRDNLNERIAMDGFSPGYTIAYDEVATACLRLKSNKNDGGSDLTTNRFRYADTHLFVRIARLFRVC